MCTCATIEGVWLLCRFIRTLHFLPGDLLVGGDRSQGGSEVTEVMGSEIPVTVVRCESINCIDYFSCALQYLVIELFCPYLFKFLMSMYLHYGNGTCKTFMLYSPYGNMLM